MISPGTMRGLLRQIEHLPKNEIDDGHENQHAHEEPGLGPAGEDIVDMRRGFRSADDQVVFQLARLAALEHFGEHGGEAEADQLIGAGEFREAAAEGPEETGQLDRRGADLPDGCA